jgi:hypothetical protein
VQLRNLVRDGLTYLSETSTVETTSDSVSSILFQSPVRSDTADTIADSAINTQELYDCHDENCAFKWMTYVADYAFQTPNTPQKTTWSRVSIHDLLHRNVDNSFCKKLASGHIRHVHLPANNMKWVEVRTNFSSAMNILDIDL